MRQGKAIIETRYECTIIHTSGREKTWDFQKPAIPKSVAKQGWSLKPGTTFKAVKVKSYPMYF